MAFQMLAIVFLWGNILPIASAQSLNRLTTYEPGIYRFITDTTSKSLQPGGHEIRMMLETDIGTGGHHRLHIRITPHNAGRFATSGDVEIRCKPWFTTEFENCEASIVIPVLAGETEANGSALLKFSSTGNYYAYYELRTYFEGRFRPESSTRIQNQRSAASYSHQSLKQRLILISERSESLNSGRTEAIRIFQTSPDRWYSPAKTAKDERHGFGCIERLPNNWLELSNFTTILIDARDVLTLPDASVSVLNHYVQGGGRLVINRTTDQSKVFEKLTRGVDYPIQGDIQFPQTQSSAGTYEYTSTGSRPDLLSDEFDLLPGTSWDMFCELVFVDYQNYDWMVTPGGLGTPALPWISSEEFTDALIDTGLSYVDSQIPLWNSLHKVWRNLEFDAAPVEEAGGTEGRTFPDTAFTVRMGLGSIHFPRRFQASDHDDFPDGITNHGDRFSGGIDDDYWRWLIPTVGKTPAWAFLIFVGAFVGVVAPGLMAWSNRTKRRVWLLLLMPVFALLATLGLFTFGFINDGMASMTRIRSYTVLDRDGNGMAWSRQTCFTAFIPDGGMPFGPETMVNRIVARSELGDIVYAQKFQGDKQVYTNYLPARRQTQFVLLHPIRALKLAESVVLDGDTLRIKNETDYAWRGGVFVDPTHRTFALDRLEPGASVELQPIDLDDARMKLMQLHNQVPLQAPLDAPTGNQKSLGEFFFGYSRYRSPTSQGLQEEDLWSDIIRLSPNKHLSFAMSTGTHLPPPKNSFVLYVEQAPHLEKCLPKGEEVESLHGIAGYW